MVLHVNDRLDLDLAFEIKDAATLQLNPIALQPADDLSSARRGLEGAKGSLAQSIGPIRRQHAMSSAGYRILGGSLGGGKMAADKVERTVSGRSHDQPRPI